jgi:TPR repeat protein
MMYGTLRRLRRRDAGDRVLPGDLQVEVQDDEKVFEDKQFAEKLDEFNQTVVEIASSKSNAGMELYSARSSLNSRPGIPESFVLRDESTLELAATFRTSNSRVDMEEEAKRILGEAADVKVTLHQTVENAIAELRAKELAFAEMLEKLNLYCKLLEQAGASRSKGDLIVLQLKALSKEASGPIEVDGSKIFDSMRANFEGKVLKDVVANNLYRTAEELRRNEPAKADLVRELLEEAARNGSDQASMRLYKLSGDLKWLEIAGQNGNERAQEKLGGIYFKELADYEKARYWFEQCSKKSTIAMSHLAYMYQHGIGGVQVNPEDAFYWYHCAAEKGCSTSMNNVGWCYQTGFGIEKNLHKAFKWFQRAAHADCVNAMGNLGRCFLTGEGVKGGKPDSEEAVFWFRKAADRGCEISMSYLAKCYEQGKGVKKSITKAKYWAEQAKSAQKQK